MAVAATTIAVPRYVIPFYTYEYHSHNSLGDEIIDVTCSDYILCTKVRIWADCPSICYAENRYFYRRVKPVLIRSPVPSIVPIPPVVPVASIPPVAPLVSNIVNNSNSGRNRGKKIEKYRKILIKN